MIRMLKDNKELMLMYNITIEALEKYIRVKRKRQMKKLGINML